MATFRLDLTPSGDGPHGLNGLKMASYLTRGSRTAIVPVSGAAGVSPTAAKPPPRTRGLVFAALVLIVLVLTFLVVSLLYFAYRVNASVHWVAAAVQPMALEVEAHAMNMLRNGDSSSAAATHIMEEMDTAMSVSIPRMFDELNRTLNSLSTLQKSLAHPSVHLTLD